MAFLDATLLISFVEYHPPQSSLKGGSKKQHNLLDLKNPKFC